MDANKLDYKAEPSFLLFRLTTRNLLIYLGLPAIAAILMQAVLGASPLVILLVVLTISLGFIGFALLGAYNNGAWFSLIYIASNELVALYAKTVMAQAITSHLYVPTMSFFVLFITTLELLTALVFIKKINIGRPLTRSTTDTYTLAWISWCSYGFGVLAWFLNQYFQSQNGSGFGGFALLIDLLLMAVIARTAMLICKNKNRRSMDLTLLLMIATSVFLGLLSNSKAFSAFPVISYFATVVFFRRAIPVKQVVMLIVGATFFILILVPLIQAWRYFGQESMPTDQRIQLMLRGVHAVTERGEMDRYVRLSKIQFRNGYYNYYGGNGRDQILIGRYSEVQQIDPIISKVNSLGTLGGHVIWTSLSRLLPSVIYSNKPKYVNSYYIARDLGLILPSGGKYPTVPLAGQAYAGYGMLGVIIIPFVTFLCVFMTMKKIGWNLHQNIFSIFVFCIFVIFLTGPGTVGQFFGAILRSFPEFGIAFYSFIVISRLKHARRIEVS
jgi:hypothetical protein